MAISSTTSSVYINVIEDVINKIRDEFISNGPGETVLNELQGMWEMKMMQAGAVCGPIERNSAPHKMITPGSGVTPVHDLNVPYEGPEEYETPTAEMLFPPTPLQTPAPTPLPGSAENSMYNIPTGNSDYPTPSPTPGNDNGVNAEMKSGRPSPFMPPPSPWMNQRHPVSVDVNVGADEGDRGSSRQSLTQDFFMMSAGKRKRDDFASQNPNNGHIPQQDGAGDTTPDLIEFEISQGSTFIRHGGGDAAGQALATGMKSSMIIPQLDGPIPDPYDEMLSTPNIYNYQGGEDCNVANTPAPNDVQASTPAVNTQNDVGEEDDDDEPPLNEDDDDDVDEIDQQEESNTHHLVLAQFDKVTRTKSRWKCTLKDGIMHIQNKDVLFNKASGEFDF